jgi:hypothetical protein
MRVKIVLNEYKEYYDYTKDLSPNYRENEKITKNTSYYGRIISETIIDKTGIKRILSIIARRYIFHDLKDISKIVNITPENKDKQILQADTALKQWSSSDVVENPLHTDLIGSSCFGKFYSYLNDLLALFMNIKDYNNTYNKINTAISAWRKYVDNTLTKNFYSTDKEHSIKNKFGNKIITFDLIIASALDDGPLTNNCVYIPHKSFEKAVEAFETKYYKYIDVFILMSALYAAKYKKNNEIYQVIELTDVTNWIGTGKVKSQHAAFNKVLSSKAVYGTDLIQNVVNKVSYSQDFIKDFLVKEMKDGQIPEEKDEFFLVSDEKSMDLIRNEIKDFYVKAHKRMYPQKRKAKKTQE